MRHVLVVNRYPDPPLLSEILHPPLSGVLTPRKDPPKNMYSPHSPRSHRGLPTCNYTGAECPDVQNDFTTAPQNQVPSPPPLLSPPPLPPPAPPPSRAHRGAFIGTPFSRAAIHASFLCSLFAAIYPALDGPRPAATPLYGPRTRPYCHADQPY